MAGLLAEEALLAQLQTMEALAQEEANLAELIAQLHLDPGKLEFQKPSCICHLMSVSYAIHVPCSYC